MEKKIRFGDLVRNSGRPQVLTLWTAPEKDPTVARATKENRVLTVLEEPGKTPYGRLGLKTDPHAVFLLFPRPLTADHAARIIGINYQLIEQPEAKHPVTAANLQPKPTKPKPKPTPTRPVKPRPATRTFTVRVRRTATLDETRKIEARDQCEAKRRAMHIAQAEPFDLAKAVLRDQVVKAE
jgi:hypothetical protein